MLFEGLVYQGKQKWRRRGPSRQSKVVIHARVESATQCGGPPLSLYNYLHSFSLSYHPNLSVGERERRQKREGLCVCNGGDWRTCAQAKREERLVETGRGLAFEKICGGSWRREMGYCF